MAPQAERLLPANAEIGGGLHHLGDPPLWVRSLDAPRGNGIRITSTQHLAEVCAEELRQWEVVIERKGRIIRSQFRA